jgi:hypothetical protein
LFFQVSFYCDVLGIIIVAFVLALSTLPIRAKVSAGPRVFAVNLLIFNLAYALCSFFNDLPFVNQDFAEFAAADYGNGKSTDNRLRGLRWTS